MNRTILILANSIGGLYSFRKEVVKAIVDEGYKVVVSVPFDESEKTRYFQNIGCEIVASKVDRRGTNPLRDLSLLLHYRQQIRDVKPVAVLTYTIKPNIYGGIAARWCGVPQLANITGLGDAIENPGMLQKLSIFMYRLGLKKATKVFYQNSSIETFCKEHRIGNSGQLLPGSGVNLEWHALQEYPAPDSKMKFNFIGRVMKDKGIEEFFAMAKNIHQQYEHTEFHIFGNCEENYESRLKFLQEEGIVVWHGAVPDVRPYIGDSWCTVHPSYHEGMANVLLETCAAGRPVIACNINGCKEAIDDGVNGFLCRVKDAEDLKQKVKQFISLPYEQKIKMGKAARRKVEREFDRRLVVEAYLVGIDEAVNRKTNACDVLQSTREH